MSKHFYEFGPFRIDLSERVLLRDGQPVQLTPKAFETLLVLVERCGHVVEKDELMNRVWPDTFVEEVGLARNISALRKVLEDGSDEHRYIETIPKRGYRFRAEIREWEEGASDRLAAKNQPLKVVPEMENSSDLVTGRASALGAAPALSARTNKTQTSSLEEEPTVTTASSFRNHLPRWMWVTGLLAVLSAVGVGWWLVRTGSRTAEVASAAVPLTSYLGVECQPSFSPDGSQVAFSWNGEKQDNFDVYVKLIGSETQLRLTTAPEADSLPAWSPDGRSIAFIRERPGGKASVFLVSPLGPPERKVPEISETGTWPGGLAWTADGKSLVVTDKNSEREPPGLFLLSVGSGEKQRLTSPPGRAFVDSQPAFSPNGRTLAFVREVATGVRDVYLLTVSEDFRPIGEPKRLTFENQVVFRPAWTSDGREIVFSSRLYLIPSLFRIASSSTDKPQRLAAVGEGGYEATISHRTQSLLYTREFYDTNIWCLELPGPHEKISAPTRLIASTREEGSAQFSPDGKRIVFSSNRTGSLEIWICNRDGSNAQQLTSLGGFCGSPRWSPDGERIAFDALLEGQWEIYVVSPNGGNPSRITRNPASDAVPSWSRDGNWIYFASNRSGEYQVWKAPVRGGEPVRVTWKGGFEALESPDGQWVYYTDGNGDAPCGLSKVPRNGGGGVPSARICGPAGLCDC